MTVSRDDISYKRPEQIGRDFAIRAVMDDHLFRYEAATHRLFNRVPWGLGEREISFQHDSYIDAKVAGFEVIDLYEYHYVELKRQNRLHAASRVEYASNMLLVPRERLEERIVELPDDDAYLVTTDETPTRTLFVSVEDGTILVTTDQDVAIGLDQFRAGRRTNPTTLRKLPFPIHRLDAVSPDGALKLSDLFYTFVSELPASFYAAGRVRVYRYDHNSGEFRERVRTRVEEVLIDDNDVGWRAVTRSGDVRFITADDYRHVGLYMLASLHTEDSVKEFASNRLLVPEARLEGCIRQLDATTHLVTTDETPPRTLVIDAPTATALLGTEGEIREQTLEAFRSGRRTDPDDFPRLLPPH